MTPESSVEWPVSEGLHCYFLQQEPHSQADTEVQWFFGVTFLDADAGKEIQKSLYAASAGSSFTKIN